MKNESTLKKLVVPIVVMLAFWGVAILGFTASGAIRPLIMFGYIGTALGVGLGLYGTLPKSKNQSAAASPSSSLVSFSSSMRFSWDTRTRSSKARSLGC